MKRVFGMSKEEFYKWVDNILYPELEYRSIEKDYDIAKNVNESLCTKCGGTCCKNCGCHFSPDDFEEISFEFLKKELEKGYIAIDYVDGEMIYSDRGAYFLRIRNQEEPIAQLEDRRRRPCILLTEKGCKLDYQNRPTGGKLLIPKESTNQKGLMVCESKYRIKDCCYEWMPHQKVLKQLIQYFKNKDIPCSL